MDTDKTLIVELLPDPEAGGFTACVPNIPAYGEGETEEEAIADMKVALRGHIEHFGLEDTLALIAEPKLLRIDLDLEELACGKATASHG